MELFAMGFVDSEGNLVEENVLRDAQRTAALTAKIMKEKMDNTWEMEAHLNRIFCAWLIYSDTNFSRSITYIIGREAACVEEHLWMVGEALDDDDQSGSKQGHLQKPADLLPGELAGEAQSHQAQGCHSDDNGVSPDNGCNDDTQNEHQGNTGVQTMQECIQFSVIN